MKTITNRNFLFVILVISQLAFGKDPDVRALIDPCGPVLASLVDGQSVVRKDIYFILGSKFEMRLLGEGGPIAQPEFYAGIRPEKEAMAKLAKNHDQPIVDTSVKEKLVGLHRTVSIDDIAKHLEDGSIQFPLKPNRNAHGNRIVFLERVGDSVTLTMAHADSDSSAKFKGTRKVISELKATGVSDVNVDEAQQITKITFNRDKHSLSKILPTIWKQLNNEEFFGDGMSLGTYDAGMIESMMNVFRYRDRAYETRHKFEADFNHGVTKPVKAGDDGNFSSMETPGSIARRGSSPYFSNQTGRISAEKTILPSNEMYNPLFETFHMDGARRQEFAAHVHELIQAEVAHYIKRLKESGIQLDEKMDGQIDLMWLPPASANGFPRPVIIEAEIIPDFPLNDLVTVKKTRP